jgi:hypothetical protein
VVELRVLVLVAVTSVLPVTPTLTDVILLTVLVVVDVLVAVLLALVAEPEEGNLQESGVGSKGDLKQLGWREPPLG